MKSISVFPFPPPFLSGLEVKRYAWELDALLRDRFVQKIHLCDDGVLGLQTYGESGREWIIFSSSDRFPALFLTEKKPEHVPSEPRSFARVLRQCLEGGKILAVEQVASDRAFCFVIGRGGTPWRLMVEILGKFTNAVLLEEDDRIRACLKNEPDREIRPGKAYAPPLSGQKVPYDDPNLEAALRQALEETDHPFRALVGAVEGFSPLLAKEALFRSGEKGIEIPEAVREVANEAGGPGHSAWVHLNGAGTPAVVSGVRLTHTGPEIPREELPDLVRAMSRLGEEILPKADLLAAKSELERNDRQELKRLKRDLKKALGDLEQSEREEEFRLKAEMLLANLRLMKKGDKQAEIPNLYSESGETLHLDLDPLLSPSENADRYFKRAAKAARAKEGAAARVRELNSRIESLEQRLQRIEEAESLENLEEVADVRFKALSKGEREKKERIDPLRKLARVYKSRDGVAIWVGRGPKESDELLRRYARGHDVWIHSKDVPGPHVIIHPDAKGGGIPHETILDAAHLAAHFGKARGEKSVPVYMTEVRRLSRPKKAPPGKVVVGDDRGFDVRIDPSRLERLLKGK